MGKEEKAHPVVELMLARIKSHPEEFTHDYSTSRWMRALTEIATFGSEEEKALLDEELKTVRLDAAHKWAMDELLNGDERRKTREEEDVKLSLAKIGQYAQMGQLASAAPGAGAPSWTGLAGVAASNHIYTTQQQYEQLQQQAELMKQHAAKQARGTAQAWRGGLSGSALPSGGLWASMKGWF